MFTNISWTDYLITIAVLSVIYYTIVILLYYTAELKQALTQKEQAYSLNNDSGNSHMDIPENTEVNEPSLFGDDDNFNEVEQLITALKSVIADAAGIKPEEKNFRHNLSLTLQQYPSIKKSPLRS